MQYRFTFTSGLLKGQTFPCRMDDITGLSLIDNLWCEGAVFMAMNTSYGHTEQQRPECHTWYRVGDKHPAVEMKRVPWKYSELPNATLGRLVHSCSTTYVDMILEAMCVDGVLFHEVPACSKAGAQ